MAIKIFTSKKTGKTFWRGNPNDVADVRAKELKYKKKFNPATNKYDGATLTKSQRYYNAGYLAARQDNADAYNYNKAKKAGKLKEFFANLKARRSRKKAK